MQLRLRRRTQSRQLQSRGGDHVRHVGAGAARDGVHADPAAGSTDQTAQRGRRRRLGARQGGRDIEQLVETVDPLDPVLAKDGGDDLVGSGQVAGVGLGHGSAFVGSPHLYGHDGHLAPGRRVGSQLEGAAVLEPLDVAGHRAGGREAREVVDEVGGLQVRLVARRRPVRQLDPDLLALEHRAALVPALGDQRHGGTGEVVAEHLERVEVRVRSEQVGVSGFDDPLHLRLDPLALRASLGEPCREDDGELRPGRNRVPEDGKRVSDEDGDEIELLVDVGQRLHRRAPRHDGAVRVHVVHGGAARFGPGGDLPGQGRVRAGAGVGRTDDRHSLRIEERIEVDVAQRGGTAGDVERRIRPRHLPPSLPHSVARRTAPPPAGGPSHVGPLLRRAAAKQHASQRGLHGR